MDRGKLLPADEAENESGSQRETGAMGTASGGMTANRTVPWALCCAARSGSSWFCQLIGSAGCLGRPNEFFLDDLDYCHKWFGREPGMTPEQYLDYLISRYSTPNSVFGVKGSLDQLETFFRRFPDPPCVWLRRRNEVAQAISWFIADRGGRWTRSNGVTAGKVPEFDLEAILVRLRWVRERNRVWNEWFAGRGIVPEVVEYESLCVDPLAAVRCVAAHIGVDPTAISPGALQSTLEIVRDETSQKWERDVRKHLEPEGGTA